MNALSAASLPGMQAEGPLESQAALEAANNARILAFAYACEPRKGSEPGAGWVWARMLAQLGEVWVLTRENNRASVERAISEIRERERLHFEYVDLPAWARFWKRGGRGVRAYYLLWQVAALKRGRSLHKKIGFDGVWHLTLANVWLGSLAPLVGPRFVYGPVGGGVSTPWRFLDVLGWRGLVYEIARELARVVGRYLNPMARLAWRRAAVILVQNTETRAWVPAAHRCKAEVFPNAVMEELPVIPENSRQRPPCALFAGRLLPWKGGVLAIRTMAELPEWRLLICGKGPDEARLRRLARRLGIEDRVEFRGWEPREELLRLMRHEARAFLFPSLREEAGWAVVEALASGLPVVCLDRGGPVMLGIKVNAIGVAHRSAKQVVSSLAGALRGLSEGSLSPGNSQAVEICMEARISVLRRLSVLEANVSSKARTGRTLGVAGR